MPIYLATLNNDSTILIVWGICVGVCIGFIGNFVSKTIAGILPRALLSKKCIGAENAKTLSELELSNRKIIKLFIKDGSALRNTVSVVGGTLPKITANNKTAIDYSNARFYIASEKQEKARVTYEKGEKWYFLVIFIILAVLCSLIMAKIMPLLVETLF